MRPSTRQHLHAVAIVAGVVFVWLCCWAGVVAAGVALVHWWSRP